ncbi:MAG: dCTP deaminase [Candidatus Bathyarchaeia archaeon]|nr:dCTP deaminase [Candidatus Bathyarchaeota archaeon]
MIIGHNLIKKYIQSRKLVIEPFSDEIVREAGLDLRIAEDTTMEGGEVKLIWTLEYIRMPVDLIGFCNLRSTWARAGLIISPTIVDPGFEGQLVIEVYNPTRHPIKIAGGERFLHLILAKCEGAIPYRGRYQGQKLERDSLHSMGKPKFTS